MISLAVGLFALLILGVAQAEVAGGRSVEATSAVTQLIQGTLPKGAERDRRFQAFLQDFSASDQGAMTRKRVYDAHVDALGVSSIVEFLEGRDPHCHGVAHSLGASIGERTDSLADGMAVCGEACTYACVHGVFKAYFTKNAHSAAPATTAGEQSSSAGERAGNQHANHAAQGAHEHHDHAQVAPGSELFNRFTAEAVATCREDSTVVPGFYRGNCAHAVGHAFASLAPNVKEANEYCSAFPGREMQYYCETGVFMELEDQLERDLNDDRSSSAQRRAQVIDFCNANSRSPSACLRFLLTRNRSVADVDEFAVACSKLTGAVQRRGCFNALGFFSRTFSVEVPDQLPAICRHGDEADRQVCIAGVVLAKKGHRHEAALVKNCKTLTDSKLATLCRDQADRSYYQPGNPVMELMLGSTP